MSGHEFVNKLPAITGAFWFLKITATTLGETGGDWLSMTMEVGYLASTAIFFSFFLFSLLAQLLSRKHRPFLYWSVIVATSTAGTTLSDYMDRTLGLGYSKGALILITILFTIMVLWKLSVGTLSVERIQSRKAEVFYWLTILFSNTLGTALGDFLADDSGLGFLGSWLLISGLLLVILISFKWTSLSRVLLFWCAFVLTRPFGATFGDLLTKSADKGGLDLGTAYASLVLLLILILGIALLYPRKLVISNSPEMG
ncbi:MAG: hypothetical protein EOP07_18755 [Proteobacteria bacterium]|nr:MAG: hypothetical protein EOP07_18755 [Pseudomonadota bacterium]